MPQLVHVRPATPRDADAIAAMNLRLAQESEGHALDPATVARGVAAALNDPARALYFVAESDGRVAGQTLVTFEWSDWRNGFLWWLGSVYVAPELRGRGVFRALHARVEQEARAAGAVGLRLYVWNENERARATYARLGWADANYRLLERMF
jgi:GNAT superfamily N-acetyltransferase